MNLSPAKWQDGEFRFPGRENWNGGFKTPEYIGRVPISHIRNVVIGATDKGHHCRNCDKITTARCYDERGHMSWCVYWVEERGLPCGNRCRNTHEYCEKHTKLRPADYLQDQDETAQEEQGVAEQLGDNNGGQEQHEEQGITEPLEDSNGGHEQQEEQGVAGQLEDADGGHEQEGQDLWEQEDGEQGQGSWIQYQEPTKPYTEKHIPQPRLRKKEVRLQKEAERAVTFAQKIKDVFGKKGRKMMKQRTGY